MNIDGHGIHIDLPSGWSGRIFDHRGDPDSDDRPTLHAGSFGIPNNDADYGSGVIATMASHHVFFSLIEFTPDATLPTADPAVLTALVPPVILPEITARSGAPLDVGPVFGGLDIPLLDPAAFAREAVHCPAGPPDPAATQVRFVAGGRPFMLYAVIGEYTNANALVGQLNQALSTLRVSPAMSCAFRLTLRGDYPISFAPFRILEPQQSGGQMRGVGTAYCSVGQADGGRELFTVRVDAEAEYVNTSCLEPLLVHTIFRLGYEVSPLPSPLPEIPLVEDPVYLETPGGPFPPTTAYGTFNIQELVTTPSVGTLTMRSDPIAMPAIVLGPNGAGPQCLGDVTSLELASSFMIRYAGVPEPMVR